MFREEIAMRVPTLLRWALPVVLTLYVSQAMGDQSEGSLPRTVTVERVRGSCRNCGASFDLGRVQFVSRQEGWAVGEQLSATGNGSGVSTILHTTDGGRIWTRLSWVWQHGAEAGPSFWFVDGRHGWVSWIDESAVHHLSRTINGGGSWQKLPNPPAQAFAAIQFFDSDNGISIGIRLSEKPLFGTTADGGQTWTTKELPIKYVGQAQFLDRAVGWLVGMATSKTDERRLAVLRTVDGGANWAGSALAEVPYEVARDCDWTDRTSGWLIAWLTDAGGSHLLRTEDGGSSWHRHRDETFQGTGKYLKAIRFVSKRVGYAFFDDTQTGNHYVLSTRDGGETWERAPLKESVSSCQVVVAELWCSAGMDLLKLRTAAALPSGASD